MTDHFHAGQAGAAPRLEHVDQAMAPGDAATSLLSAGPAQTVATPPDKGNSLWSDALQEMRRSPMFWASLALVLVFLLMALVPGLFTRTDPTACDLAGARTGPSGAHPFGTDLLGCDVYARTVHGARSSVLVGVLTTIGTTVLGALVGIISGYAGGWLDTLLSRLGEVFFAIPLLLGGIVVLYSFPSAPRRPTSSSSSRSWAPWCCSAGPASPASCAPRCCRSSPTSTCRPPAPWARARGGSSSTTSCPTRWPP